MTETGKGVLALIGACTVWGLSPLFYKVLSQVPALEVLAHRSLWSLLFFLFYLGYQRRISEVLNLLRRGRRLALVILASGMIAVNWLLFIWSIQNGRTVEASLGYYIFPLVSVLMGVIFYGEGLRGPKAVSVMVAALAVVVLTLGLGAAPWISLALALTFGVYGTLKKSVAAGPVVSVTAEVLLFAPFALFFLWMIHSPGQSIVIVSFAGTFGTNWIESVCLILSGPLTALPLVLFSYGARRVTMATTGLVQYLNPSLQFAVATLIFLEPFTIWHAIAFPMIWLALAIYSVGAVRQDRSARKASIKAGTSSTTVK